MSNSPEMFLFWGQPEEEWNIDKTTEYRLCIQNTVTEIGEFSFKDYNFTSLIFQSPSALKTINGFSFHDCNNLTMIDFPEGLEDIHYYAFAACKSLRHVHFPSTLKSLGTSCFRGCRNLSHELQLPNSLEMIGDCALDSQVWRNVHSYH